MRRNSLRISAACVGAALALAGCGSGETAGQATPSTPTSQSGSASGTSTAAPSSSGATGSVDQQSVAWMDQFCGQVLKFVSVTQLDKPQVEKGDVAGAHQALSDYLGKVITKISSMLDGLNGLPSAPVAEGDQAVSNFVDVFTPARDNLKSVKTKLDSSAPTDRQAVLTAVQGVKSFGRSIQEVSNPLKVLQGSGLNEAGKQAANCQKLDS